MSGLDREDLGFVVMDGTTGVTPVSQGAPGEFQMPGVDDDDVCWNMVVTYMNISGW